MTSSVCLPRCPVVFAMAGCTLIWSKSQSNRIIDEEREKENKKEIEKRPGKRYMERERENVGESEIKKGIQI